MMKAVEFTSSRETTTIEKGYIMKKANIRIEKEKHSTVSEFGVSNAKFYGYCFVDNKRFGTVWKFKDDGRYIVNQDFDRKLHSAINRPLQVNGNTLQELKKNLVNVL